MRASQSQASGERRAARDGDGSELYSCGASPGASTATYGDARLVTTARCTLAEGTAACADRCRRARRAKGVHKRGKKATVRRVIRGSKPGQIRAPEHWPHRTKIAEESPSRADGHDGVSACLLSPTTIRCGLPSPAWLLLVALVEKSHIPTVLLVACAGGGERTFFASSHPDQISRAVSQLCL